MYTLNFTNQAVDAIDKAPIDVPPGVLDSTSTSLTLTGKGATNFGKFQQENLLRLLENFADSVEPTNPTIGQTWYDHASKTLKVLISAIPVVWKSLGGVQITEIGEAPPVPAALGDIWFERTGSASGFLYVYTGIGRYPTTATTIGGWDQIWPQVEVFAGREEYDLLRESIEFLCGSSDGSLGSGAIGRSITNLTNFGALDRDLRAKYKALAPEDQNILNSQGSGISTDREITRQAISNTSKFFVDGSSGGDGLICNVGIVNPNTLPASFGSIYIDGVLTPFTSTSVIHRADVTDAYIVWDSSNTLLVLGNPLFVARQLPDNSWEYDNNALLTMLPFTPTADMYVVGTISTYQSDNNTYPSQKQGIVWESAVPIVGKKYEHLKVEPNSQDWDALLAAAKYATNRLEVPPAFASSISSMSFVSDGRPAHSSLLNLDSLDPRYPSAARRSNRRGSAIRLIQSFNETLNALSVAFNNRFTLQGMNGATGTYPLFKPTTTTTLHAASSEVGLTGTGTTGNPNVRIRFNFGSLSNLTSFIGSGSAIQIELAHTGGVGAGDVALASLFSAYGVLRINADKVRAFGQSLPLTLAQVFPNGLWNADGTTVGFPIATIVQGGTTMVVSVQRGANIRLELQIDITLANQTRSGTTTSSFSIIKDSETYLPGPNPVFAGPVAFVPADVLNPW